LRILIIEDDPDKFRGLVSYLGEVLRSAEYHQARSLNSGLKRLEGTVKFDLLLLDMSLPTFDVGRRLSGAGAPQTFGGQDVLDVLDAESETIPTILVTRYGRFADGPKTVELTEIDRQLARKYEWYLGYVHYSAMTDAWKKQLVELIGKKFKKELKT